MEATLIATEKQWFGRNLRYVLDPDRTADRQRPVLGKDICVEKKHGEKVVIILNESNTSLGLSIW